ncbi:hypothetical protein [Paenibacillus sp. FSL L8-0158]|uniref:hypothetical protein n=1 Tax=Paenibacillus sp. FSL L8-0158 TaxID=2954752 RepID=UPI00315922C9
MPGSDQEMSWSDTLKNWSTEKARGTADYYLGIGSAKKLWELLQSCNEARRAITVAQRSGCILINVYANTRYRDALYAWRSNGQRGVFKCI